MDDELEARIDRMLLDSEESGGESQLDDSQNSQHDLSASAEDDPEEDIWDEEVRESYRWPFTETSGINYDAVAGCSKPIDFYRLFVDDEMINFIVNETNRYGCQKNPKWVTNYGARAEEADSSDHADGDREAAGSSGLLVGRPSLWGPSHLCGHNAQGEV